MITYAWTDPHTDQSRETGFLVPGAAWDSIRKEVVFVIHFDPFDHNFLLLDHTEVPRRSRCHIRACERDQTESPGPQHVVNKPNICPFYVQCPTYHRFVKLHKKAASLRNRKQDWIKIQLEANNFFKRNCMMSDDGFQHLNLNQVSGAAIVAPDPAQVYNFTETDESIAASATSSRPPLRVRNFTESGETRSTSATSSRTADTSSRTKTHTAASASSKNYYPPLPREFAERVQDAFRDCGLDPKKQGLYVFVERVATVYHAKHSSPKRGPDMHLDRNECTRDACTLVITKMLAVPGWTDVEVVSKKMVPVMECIFRMPAKGPPRGSPQWLRLQLQELNLVTFEDLCEFPALMRAHCKREVSTAHPFRKTV